MKGYELGVNNYIKKPFLAEELDAHIGALLKMKRGMGAANESEIYRIGENYTFDAVHAVLKAFVVCTKDNDGTRSEIASDAL